MVQSDVFKRYLDAGAAFTQLTQKRAEAIVSEFVSAGEVQASQASQAVQELIDRSRATTEAMVAQVRDEVRGQIKSLGLATKTDIDRLERRIDAVSKSSGSKKSTAKKSTAKKSTAKKSTAKKSTAKKSTAKKSTAKKSTGARKSSR